MLSSGRVASTMRSAARRGGKNDKAARLRDDSQMNGTLWTIAVILLVIPSVLPCGASTSPESNPVWDWASDHYDACRKQIFGDVERWHIMQLPIRGSVTVVITMYTDDFLDLRLVASYTGPKLAYTQILVAEGTPIFDQLRALREKLPDATPEHIFKQVRMREISLSGDTLDQLQKQLDRLRSTEIKIPWEQTTYIAYVHGLYATLFVDFGVDDYSFDLNLPHTRAPKPPSSLTSLGEWAWQFARWLDVTIGLSAK